jgi:LuxR family transcriptional regulator, maltose regulon positive regulatory protein
MTAQGPDTPSPFQAAFPLVEAKLRPALPRPAAVPRTRLLTLLEADPRRPVISIVAPPGYGKTTLLAQWTSQGRLPVAWLTVDDADNDPSVLLSYVAAALDHVQPLGEEFAQALTGPAKRVLAAAVPRLASALHAWQRPALLVVDDVHRLVGQASLDALAALVDYLPPGFRVAIAARSEPDLPLARLRVREELLEVTALELALDEGETVAVAAAAGCTLLPEEARALTARTEGWPAGVYLAALAMARGDGLGTILRGSRDGSAYIAAYLRSEVERRLHPDDRLFLMRTSILDTVEPGIADAVTAMPGTAERLRRIAHDNLLVGEVGASGSVFRYHNLLRDFLRDELTRREPDLVPELHARAAAAYGAAGRMDPAVEHAIAGGSRDGAAALVVGSALRLYNQGQAATVDRWLERFNPEDYERQPPLAVVAAWIHLTAGRAADADRMADIAERTAYDGPSGDGSASFASQRAILLAMMCRNGPRDMLANASLAVSLEGPASPWRFHALYVLGAAHVLLGDDDRGAAVLDESIGAARASGVPGVAAMAMRAGLWLRQGAVDAAEQLAREAIQRTAAARLDESTQALSVQAVVARVAILRGDVDGAREALVRAQLVRPLATAAGPWVGVGSLLDVARAYLALSDTAGAQVALREAEQIIRVRPALGTMTDDVVVLRRQLAGASSALAGSSSLTSAELRVLMLLPTYLSFQEIADRLQVSRNTVKTHAVAIYGKLWASSRGEAVERAVELGLLEPYPVLAAPGGRDRGHPAP